MAWRSRLDDEIYVDLDTVKRQLHTTEALQELNWPEALRERITGPTAVLARNIASPNYEMLWFTRLARKHGFRALVIEHTADRFTAHNPAKHALARLPIVTGRSLKGQLITRRQRVVELALAEGQPFAKILTMTGESLVAYHHRKLADLLGADAPDLLDLQDILPSGPMDPFGYYVEFFKMLAGPLVLFEDFIADNQTAAFFQGTVQHAWRRVVADTGRQPQIVRLGPDRREQMPLWSAYPAMAADNPTWVRRSVASDSAGSTAAVSRQIDRPPLSGPG